MTSGKEYRPRSIKNLKFLSKTNEDNLTVDE